MSISTIMDQQSDTFIPLIPRKLLFGNAEKQNPQISPDGKWIAWVAPVEGIMNLWVGKLGEEMHPLTNDTGRGISIFLWAQNSQYLIYMQDSDGDENWHTFAVDIDNGEVRDLTPFEGVLSQPFGRDKQFPDRLLVSMNRDNPQLHDAWYIDIRTGEIEIAAKNPGNVIAWQADHNFIIRAAVAATLEGGQELLVRDTPNDPWRTLLTWTMEEAWSSGIVDFTADNNSLYLNDPRDANTSRLVTINLSTGEREVLAEDPEYDVSSELTNPNTNVIEAVAFLRERLEWEVLDETVREDLATLQAQHRGDFRVHTRDDADQLWIVGYDADDGSGGYYLYDRSTRTTTLLFQPRPALNQYPLATMEPFQFTARDGMVIHGYISFPPGQERKSLPLVLNVHGGPWVRDDWGFHPEAQWMTNRGYICMQVNYRGSNGFGKAYLNAGNKEWAGKMHDDLIDAVNWAVEQGWADPSRLAIYGGSYGGFAALVGATFTPDFFHCAVAIVGPSNLISFIESTPPYWQPFIKQLHERVGHPETEADFLRSRSPLFQVDQIRIPMLIAHGANDPRVKQAESEQIVAAMIEKEIPHQYMLFPDEGHGFVRPENRLKFYAAAEKFLAEHLGGRFEE